MRTVKSKADVRFYYCRNAVQGKPTPEALTKMKHAPGVAVEAVPCGGRIDPRYILKAFESGADAVCVLTCPVGHCRLMEGNLRAARRVELAKELLAEAGLDAASIQFFTPTGTDSESLEEALANVAEFVERKNYSLAGVR